MCARRIKYENQNPNSKEIKENIFVIFWLRKLNICKLTVTSNYFLIMKKKEFKLF